MSSSCLQCTDPVAPCACSFGQTCVKQERSCTQCPKYVCIDDGSSSKSSGGSSSSTGATAGGAVGGVLGVAAVLAALYFFWWKPKGLAASRRRYSKHLSHRQSRLDQKRKSQAGGAGGAAGENGVSKRSSVHLHVGEVTPENQVNRRNTSPGATRDAATGALTSRTSEDDNPFGDQNRSSIGTFNDAGSIHTSEFSFRSSHTNVIPIAYIPPHSSSVSVADGQRGAYGELGGTSAAPPPRSSAIRASIPTSMASRDSLALAGAEIIELNPLPPVLTPDTPAVPHGATANGAPIRPPRSPGLDLQLPKGPTAASSPLSSPAANSNRSSRPISGFPFTSGPSSSSSPAFLTPSTSPTGGRGMSVLAERDAMGTPGSHLSTFTTRSGTSTMSYILDPPQIITPVNANGIRRVEFSKGQAAVVKIGGAGSPSSPLSNSTSSEVLTVTAATTPSSENPFDDSAAEEEGGKRHSRMESEETVKRASTGLGASSRPTSSATDTSRWTRSSMASEGSDAVQFLQGQTVTFTSPNTPSPLSPDARAANTASMISAFDGPRSARSSEAFESGTQVRPLTGSAGAPPASMNMSRSSTASGTSDGSHMSLLEGIPFMAPPLPGVGPSTSSVSLGLPINVTAQLDGSPASTNAAVFPAPPPADSASSASAAKLPPPPASSAPPFRPTSSSTSLLDGEDDDDSDPLPAPFLPFAGQRPSPSAPPPGQRVQSEAFSVRSGFGSGLSQIPFQLGFPSGFGDDELDDGRSERGSIISTGTRDSRVPPSTAGAESGSVYGEGAEEEGGDRRDSFASDFSGEAVVQEAVRTPVGKSPLAQAAVVASAPPVPSAPPAPSAPPSKPEPAEDNPFADPRASVDSIALAAQLSFNLDAEAEGK
ncbi:hypothetical protein JCM8547_001741 [Rhodosporidiobolus lusitaniae]